MSLKQHIRNWIQAMVYDLSGFNKQDSHLIIFGTWVGTKVGDNSLHLLNDLDKCRKWPIISLSGLDKLIWQVLFLHSTGVCF